MKKLYTLLIAACACIAASAASPADVQLTRYIPDRLSPAAPARAASPAATDADYTEWTSLGTGEISESVKDIESTLNLYRGAEDDEIVFTLTSEVFSRELKNDPSKKQFKFAKFLGYDDLVVDYDANEPTFRLDATPSGIPVPLLLAQDYGCTSIDLTCSVCTYSEARRIFTFNNLFFLVFDNIGFRTSFTISLPDAHPEIGVGFERVAGGTLSTDMSYTLALKLNGVDHVRYAIRHEKSFSYSDLTGIVQDNTEYKESDSNIEIVYDKGHGIYNGLVLAYDANDEYMGIFNTFSLTSNLAPEGTWVPAGRGTWYHPDMDHYPLLDHDTYETIDYKFPAEALQWEVEIEKRTDTDREIYRVVNPYSPECGLADTFNYLLDKIYAGNPESRPDAFRTDDTFWFVFDVTDPENIQIEHRPNGAGNAHFMSTAFYVQNINSTLYKDKCLRIKDFAYTDLRIDMPGFRGFGFEMTDNQNGTVSGTICPSTYEIRFAAIPSTGERLPAAEAAAEAARIANQTSTYEVRSIKGNGGEGAGLPYADLITAPSWMVVVPLDINGIAFDHSVIPLPQTTEITGVSLDEYLMQTLGLADGKCTITGLTLRKTVEPDALNLESYSLPNPYAKSGLEYPVSPVADWQFSYDTASESCKFQGRPDTGLSFSQLGFGDATILLMFSTGTKEGNSFMFPLYGIGFSGHSEYYEISGSDVFYILHLPDTGGTGSIMTDIHADAPVEYYDLQGRRIASPASGIYIRRQGQDVQKVLVK